MRRILLGAAVVAAVGIGAGLVGERQAKAAPPTFFSFSVGTPGFYGAVARPAFVPVYPSPFVQPAVVYPYRPYPVRAYYGGPPGRRWDPHCGYGGYGPRRW